MAEENGIFTFTMERLGAKCVGKFAVCAVKMVVQTCKLKISAQNLLPKD
jgi:hypothetical protein